MQVFVVNNFRRLVKTNNDSIFLALWFINLAYSKIEHTSLNMNSYFLSVKL